MKRQTFSFLLIVAIVMSFAISGYAAINSGKSESPIALQGDHPQPVGVRSGGDVITATFNDNNIEVWFSKPFGNVQITVTDSDGDIVYELPVDSNTHSSLLIPLSGLPGGIYTLTFSHGWGMMWGEFEW